MTPSIIMAIQDYVPVFISLFSFLLIAKTVGSFHQKLKPIALVGLLLCVTGGFLKATEKVLWAITTEETMWMKYSLFIFNSIGFIFLAAALWFALKPEQDEKISSPWLVPLGLGGAELILISALAIGIPGRIWFFTTLGIAFLANLAMMIFLFRLARKVQRPKIGYIFVLSFLIVISLVGLAKSPSATQSAEWFKQAMNTLSALSFAIGMWLLNKRVSESEIPTQNMATPSYQNS